MKIKLNNYKPPDTVYDCIKGVLDSGWISPGEKVSEFERRFAEMHRAKHALFMNSGTSALQVALEAARGNEDYEDSVLVPAITFPATINAVISAGLMPVLVDVDLENFVMEIDDIQKQLNASFFKAILPVHLLGYNIPMKPYLDIINAEFGDDHVVFLIEDSCETICNQLYGDIGCYSTYMAHHVTTGVGGFAVTNQDYLANRMRSLMNHGRDMKQFPRYVFDKVGFSYRPTEFEACVGLAELERVEDNLLNRRLNAFSLINYLKQWEDKGYLQIPPFQIRHNYLFFPIISKMNDKSDLVAFLHEHDIETRDLMPITNQRVYQKFFGDNVEERFPNAKYINSHGFLIPCHQNLGEKELEFIGDVFKKYYGRK